MRKTFVLTRARSIFFVFVLTSCVKFSQSAKLAQSQSPSSDESETVKLLLDSEIQSFDNLTAAQCQKTAKSLVFNYGIADALSKYYFNRLANPVSEFGNLNFAEFAALQIYSVTLDTVGGDTG